VIEAIKKLPCSAYGGGGIFLAERVGFEFTVGLHCP
jgi:hypothetical protein